MCLSYVSVDGSRKFVKFTCCGRQSWRTQGRLLHDTEHSLLLQNHWRLCRMTKVVCVTQGCHRYRILCAHKQLQNNEKQADKKLCHPAWGYTNERRLVLTNVVMLNPALVSKPPTSLISVNGDIWGAMPCTSNEEYTVACNIMLFMEETSTCTWNVND